MIFDFIASPEELAEILQRPALQNRVIVSVTHGRKYDMFGDDIGPLMLIEVLPERVDQQVILPMVSERLEATELMLSMLMDEE